MTLIRIIAPSILAIACFSCAAQKDNAYDTADTAAVNPPANAAAQEAVNPVYDTPAAYEEAGSTAAAAPKIPNEPSASNVPIRPAQSSTASAPKRPSNGAATIHTVVAGDTLSGISSKYKVSQAAIKQANGMTKDTVVLGKKMVIPTAN
jgi:LysM repeat protein